jgi:hypothetical protein
MDDLDTRADPMTSQEPLEQASQETLEQGLDRLSLTQALRDFEVANGRVIDLTERLVVTAEELVAARQELDAVRAERDELRARLDDLAARHQVVSETLERTLNRKSVKLGQAMWDARRSVPLRRRDG